MGRLSLASRLNFARFKLGLQSLVELEQWLYTSPLEQEIGSDAYMALVSLDFRNKDIVYTLYLHIHQLYQHSAKVQAWDVATLIYHFFAEGKITLTAIFDDLDQLQYESHYALPIEASGFRDEINRIGEEPYREIAAQELLTLLSVIDPAQTFLSYIEARSPTFPIDRVPRFLFYGAMPVLGGA